MKGKSAIIGDGESILVFKAVGVEPFAVKSSAEAEKVLAEIAKLYKIIFITDDFAAEIDDKIQRYNSQSYPIITSIPSKTGSNGYGESVLTRAMEKALGINIFAESEK